MYSRPFRVLQFDFVEVAGDQADGAYQHILTCICPFSRYVWLFPTVRRTAEVVADLLLKQVLCDVAGFPAVLKSDQTNEFIGEVIAEMNKQLYITHYRVVVSSADTCTRRKHA